MDIIDFLIPDSCRTTVRNGNSISADYTKGTTRLYVLLHVFADNVKLVLDSLTLQENTINEHCP